MILYLGTCVGNWLCMYQCIHLPGSLCAFLCCQGFGQGLGAKRRVPGVPRGAGQGPQKVVEPRLGSGLWVLVSMEAAAGRAACVSLERPSIARG